MFCLLLGTIFAILLILNLYIMGFTITVKHSWVDSEAQNDILQQLLLIKKQNQTIMSQLDDLKAKVSELDTKATTLQQTVDAEQEQIQALLTTNAEVVTGLNQQIATLQDQIANGATPEQLQEVATSLTAISEKIDAASADVASTVADEPTGGGETGGGETTPPTEETPA